MKVGGRHMRHSRSDSYDETVQMLEELKTALDNSAATSWFGAPFRRSPGLRIHAVFSCLMVSLRHTTERNIDYNADRCIQNMSTGRAVKMLNRAILKNLMALDHEELLQLQNDPTIAVEGVLGRLLARMRILFGYALRPAPLLLTLLILAAWKSGSLSSLVEKVSGGDQRTTTKLLKFFSDMSEWNANYWSRAGAETKTSKTFFIRMYTHVEALASDASIGLVTVVSMMKAGGRKVLLSLGLWMIKLSFAGQEGMGMFDKFAHFARVLA